MNSVLRFLLLTLLFLLLNQAKADWVFVTQSADRYVYLDFSTIKDNGKWISINSLMSLKTPKVLGGQISYQSSVLDYQLECSARRYRDNGSIAYSEPMSNGNVVLKAPADLQWQDVGSPTSLIAGVLNAACNSALARQAKSYANWSLLTWSPNHDVRFYIDLSSIRKAGGFRTAWIMTDETYGHDVGNATAKSATNKAEYDCANETQRFIAIRNYSDRMTLGTPVVMVNETQQWTSESPGSMGGTILKFICSYRMSNR
jgi:hypothetical protein